MAIAPEKDSGAIAMVFDLFRRRGLVGGGVVEGGEGEGVGADGDGFACAEAGDCDADAFHGVVFHGFVRAPYCYGAGTAFGEEDEFFGIVKVEHFHLDSAHGVAAYRCKRTSQFF